MTANKTFTHAAMAGRRGDGYYLSYYRGETLLHTRLFDTLEELISAMSEIEPDLDKWGFEPSVREWRERGCKPREPEAEEKNG